MSKIDEIRTFIKEEAARFGAKNDNGSLKDYVERNNTGIEALTQGGGLFWFYFS